MKNKEYDVIVIVAGPGGSVIARRLSQYGHSVLLIEKENKLTSFAAEKQAQL